MPLSSCAGAPTSARKTAVTISWRSRQPTSWSASSACAIRAGRLPGHPRDRSRSEEHTSELQSRFDLVCRLLLEKKKRLVQVTQCGYSVFTDLISLIDPSL